MQVYDELRHLARGYLRREPYEQTLSPTGLVHEAWLRLSGERRTPFENSRHYVGTAAQAMRRILVDRARARVAAKRRGVHVTLSAADAAGVGVHSACDRLLAVDAALAKLEAVGERLAQVVECRYFAGLTIDETAAALGVSDTTVSEDWRFARAWLRRTLGAQPTEDPEADIP
jgi:RNA polymerase sigma factor (TIGR02999 family)